jgi:hypothetical protein
LESDCPWRLCFQKVLEKRLDSLLCGMSYYFASELQVFFKLRGRSDVAG